MFEFEGDIIYESDLYIFWERFKRESYLSRESRKTSLMVDFLLIH